MIGLEFFTDVAPPEINKINYLNDWKTFQQHVANVLRKTYGGVKEEMYIGLKPNGVRFRADIVLTTPDKMTIIDTKLKNNGGTPDEKIMDKAYWLQHACTNWNYKNGIIIYGGTHWNKKVVTHLADTILPQLFPDVTMLRYEDDVELKNV